MGVLSGVISHILIIGFLLSYIWVELYRPLPIGFRLDAYMFFPLLFEILFEA